MFYVAFYAWWCPSFGLPLLCIAILFCFNWQLQWIRKVDQNFKCVAAFDRLCFVFQYPSNPLDLMKYRYHLSHYVVDCVGWLWQLDTCFRLQLQANEHASIIHRTSNTCIVATDDANLRSLAFSLMTPIRGLFVFAFQSPSNQQKHLPKSGVAIETRQSFKAAISFFTDDM